ncbi:MAG: ornithine cyclodeaminase [Betaproteobacteria bacterium]|nr:ornithine cyclodeaminase [Betaproteobacteria bacterium]
MILLLTPRDIARIVAHYGLPHFFGSLARQIEDDFRRWREFDKSVRAASHSKFGVIELMPISDARTYSFKYVNGHPSNTRIGLPTVVAFGGLADVATGIPRLLSELTLTTAFRTAATSVVAARVLARPGSRTMALIGNGAQSEFQALAFYHLMGITDVRLYDIDPAATAKLLNNLAGVEGLRLTACRSTREAVQGTDIVTTITADKALATIISEDMLEPGMHINAVGGDCPGKTELAAGVLARAKVFVEYEPQTRVEGDLQQMPADFAVTELWRVLTGSADGRTSNADITVFDSVGFALQDFSALCLIERYAREMGLGEKIALIPDMADPKNLFGLLRA